jgi:TetR/AcrR family transcriptional regulator, regulator of autoinduction and epiphytic fitness
MTASPDDVRETGSLRQRQAAMTRETMISAALALFSEQGYARTTIEQIARRARVSVPTVYAVFGSKRELLAEIRRKWFREADVSQLVERALAEPDASVRLGITAEWIRRQLETGATISMVIEEAIRADPKVASKWSTLRLVADERMTAVIEGIAGQLRNGVSVVSAVEVVWALSRAAVYREFTVQQKWPPDRYQRWLADTLRQQLLGADVNPAADNP